jgi:uncharacterized protein with PIN domain
MVYVDSSALLKLLWPEPETAAVREQLAVEDAAIVSSLTELEAEVQLRARRLAGHDGDARWRRLRSQSGELRTTAPFRFQPLPGTLFQTALRQAVEEARVHCRTLDRLHLAAMAELEVIRLMTHDVAQAAAQALGFEVTMPGRRGSVQ